MTLLSFVHPRRPRVSPCFLASSSPRHFFSRRSSRLRLPTIPGAAMKSCCGMATSASKDRHCSRFSANARRRRYNGNAFSRSSSNSRAISTRETLAQEAGRKRGRPLSHAIRDLLASTRMCKANP